MDDPTDTPPVTPEMFQRWVRAHGPTLRGFLIYRGGLPGQEADDVLQRVFILAWEKRADFRGGSARSWLFTFTRFQLLSHRKRHRREVAVDFHVEEERLPTEPAPEPHTDTREVSWLRACLSQLESIEQLILSARHGLVRVVGDGEAVGPLEYADISRLIERRMGERWSPTRARKRHGIAAEKLRRCVGQRRALVGS